MSPQAPITDLHCHLLPGLDDGAADGKTAWRMAQAAVASGVGRVVCTPHCTTEDADLARRAEMVRHAAAAMNRALLARGVPLSVFTGMELLCGRGLAETLSRRQVLTLAGSRYLLLEFRFAERLSFMEWAASCARQAGYWPVLAHPERYTAVQREPLCLAEWFRAGMVLQLDKSSVLGDFGRRCAQTSHWALDRGLAHVVASDAHDTETRTASFRRVEDLITQRYSAAYAQLLLRRNPGRVVADRPMVQADDA